jgi:hypothetical protein
MTGRTIWLYTAVTLAGGAAGGALMIQLAAGVAGANADRPAPGAGRCGWQAPDRHKDRAGRRSGDGDVR